MSYGYVLSRSHRAGLTSHIWLTIVGFFFFAYILFFKLNFSYIEESGYFTLVVLIIIVFIIEIIKKFLFS
jgi:hypothetical protein